MNWFQHDTDSTQDAKIKKLLIRHGAIGYAVYFHCLELISADISESNLTFELEHDSEIIADNLKIKGTADMSGVAIVESIMRDIINLGLFTECQGRVFCLKLLKRINLSMTSSATFREAINAKKSQHHDTIMVHHDPIMTHNDKVMLPTLPTLPTKDNTSPAKPSKDKYTAQFNAFWEAYPRREGKGQAAKVYASKLKHGETPETIQARLSVYKAQIAASGTECQFIRHPSTFLNNLDDYTEAAKPKPKEPERGYSPSLKPVTMTPEEREMYARTYERGNK